MSDRTVLATISNKNGTIRRITIKNYNVWLTDKNKKKIAEMIYHRLHGRYIKPFLFDAALYKKHYKNGFSMMACACLLIETLQSFEHGWETTQGNERGRQVFKSFFAREKAFHKFVMTEFYTNVRCGILHQGETTGEFEIARGKAAGPIFNSRTRTINANRFLRELENSLSSYTERLLNEAWDSAIWDNFRRKMRFIINHC